MSVSSLKILWGLFWTMVLVTILEFSQLLFSHTLPTTLTWFSLPFFGIPAWMIVHHATHTLGWKKATRFAVIAGGIATFFEYIGLKYGTFFGGNYAYQSQPSWFGVPVMVTIFWIVFIYTGYCVTNSFLAKKHWRQSPAWALLDGILVVTIDLLLDPVAIKLGAWRWLNHTAGGYFGIPWGNFVGWFVVTVIVCGIFRTLELKKRHRLKAGWYVVPSLAYGVLLIFLSSCWLTLNLRF